MIGRIRYVEWVAMVMISIAAGSPVLLGLVEPNIALTWWVLLFAVYLAALVSCVLAPKKTLQILALTAATLSSWILVFTVGPASLTAVIFISTVGMSVYVIPVRVGLILVALNTAVLTISAVAEQGTVANVVPILGFYLLLQVATLFSTAALLREQRLRHQLTQAHVDLRSASALLTTSAQNAERLRLSRDLHDVVGHQLTVLILELEAARYRTGDDVHPHVDQASEVARQTLTNLRGTVERLRSDSSDASEALQNLVGDFPGLDIELSIGTELPLDTERIEVLVRTIQEIITNTLRHADATTLHISVSIQHGQLILTAEDNGAGAATVAIGNGLRGITERWQSLGGTVRYHGGEGFPMVAEVPVT